MISHRRHDHDVLPLAGARAGLGERAAAGVAGLVAGLATLCAQMGFPTLLGLGGALASLQRIAAILLGPDALGPNPAPTDLAMGLLIHVPLSLVAGYFIGHMARGRSAPVSAAIGSGDRPGLLQPSAFYLIAPWAFPWFVVVRNAATAVDHAMFGAITGYLVIALQRAAGSRR